MPIFDCQIGLPSGEITNEALEAVNAETLRKRLRDEGFHIISVRRRWNLLSGGNKLSSRISNRQFLAFNQELLVLLRSGLPILQVLDTILEKLDTGPLRNATEQIREAVKGGAHLSQAFGEFPRLFPHLYIASLQAGEHTGDLPITIQRYIDYQKRIEGIKSKVKMAAFYPALLCLAALGVLLFMVFFVIPKFAAIYDDARLALPLATRLLISATGILTDHWLPLLGGTLLLALLAHRLPMQGRWRCVFDRWKLRLVFIGPLLLEYALLNFTRTLATLLASGIALPTAICMSCRTLNNRHLEQCLEVANSRITEGKSPSAALEEAGFFPPLALRMVMTGERSGALQEMLFEVAGYYEERVEERLGRLSSLIEPLMMLIIGLLIGSIVVAMYIPIFQLAAAA